MRMITSRQNKKIKRFHELKLKKNRDLQGTFVAEGLRFIREIPKGRAEFTLMSESFYNEFPSFQPDGDWDVARDDIFQSACDTDTPQGIVAICRKEEFSIDDLILKKKSRKFFILAENLNDPGNLGTIIRTADACGADGVFLSKGSVDVYNNKVLRATMGSLFHLPVVQNVSFSTLIPFMKEQEIHIFAAHLRGKCYPYDLDFFPSCGLLIGNEANGLSEEIAQMANDLVRIPMPGKTESLNASVAAAVLMYEVVRQRLSAGKG